MLDQPSAKIEHQIVADSALQDARQLIGRTEADDPADASLGQVVRLKNAEKHGCQFHDNPSFLRRGPDGMTAGSKAGRGSAGIYSYGKRRNETCPAFAVMLHLCEKTV